MKNGVLRGWSWRVTGVAALISLKLRNRLQKDSEVQTGIAIRKGRSLKVIWIMKPSSPLATTCSLAHFVHRQVLGAPVHWLIACIAAAWLGSMETQSRISWANLGSWCQTSEMTPSIGAESTKFVSSFCFPKDPTWFPRSGKQIDFGTSLFRFVPKLRYCSDAARKSIDLEDWLWGIWGVYSGDGETLVRRLVFTQMQLMILVQQVLSAKKIGKLMCFIKKKVLYIYIYIFIHSNISSQRKIVWQALQRSERISVPSTMSNIWALEPSL